TPFGTAAVVFAADATAGFTSNGAESSVTALPSESSAANCNWYRSAFSITRLLNTASPSASVRTVVVLPPVNVPDPSTIVTVTSTSGTGLPSSSFTTTVGGPATACPASVSPG